MKQCWVVSLKECLCFLGDGTAWSGLVLTGSHAQWVPSVEFPETLPMLCALTSPAGGSTHMVCRRFVERLQCAREYCFFLFVWCSEALFPVKVLWRHALDFIYMDLCQSLFRGAFPSLQSLKSPEWKHLCVAAELLVTQAHVLVFGVCCITPSVPLFESLEVPKLIPVFFYEEGNQKWNNMKCFSSWRNLLGKNLCTRFEKDWHWFFTVIQWHFTIPSENWLQENKHNGNAHPNNQGMSCSMSSHH